MKLMLLLSLSMCYHFSFNHNLDCVNHYTLCSAVTIKHSFNHAICLSLHSLHTDVCIYLSSVFVVLIMITYLVGCKCARVVSNDTR